MEKKKSELIEVKTYTSEGRYENSIDKVWAKPIFESEYIKVYEYTNKYGYKRRYCQNKFRG